MATRTTLICGLALALPLAMPVYAQSVAIEGRVIDLNSSMPLAKAVLLLFGDRNSGAKTYIVETDVSGRFRVEVAPGRYYVNISKPGFAEEMSSRGAIVLAAGKPVTTVELRAVPLGVISGRVLDSDGDPLIGAYVKLRFQQRSYPTGEKVWSDRFPTTTNDLGEFRMFDVPPGRYRVCASYDGFPTVNVQAEAALTCYPSVTTVAEGSPVAVSAGSELGGLDIRLVARKPSTIPRGDVSASARRVLPESSAVGTIELSARLEVAGSAPGELDDVGVYLTPDHSTARGNFSKNPEVLRGNRRARQDVRDVRSPRRSEFDQQSD
jgi:hypothetical protein